MTTKRKAKRTGTPAARPAAPPVNTFGVRVHELKSWPSNFALVKAGLKFFEVRLNDRGFMVGDRIKLREWIPFGNGAGRYTGDEMQLSVELVSVPVGVRDGFVALTTRPAS